MIRIEADSADELLRMVRSRRRAVPNSDIIAVVPAGLDDDEVLALCAVLSIEGVVDIEGVPTVVAKRCLDAARVFVAGDLGAISP